MALALIPCNGAACRSGSALPRPEVVPTLTKPLADGRLDGKRLAAWAELEGAWMFGARRAGWAVPSGRPLPFYSTSTRARTN